MKFCLKLNAFADTIDEQKYQNTICLSDQTEFFREGQIQVNSKTYFQDDSIRQD